MSQIPHSCRCGISWWLWHKLAAVALIRPLTWDPPYVPGVALKGKSKQKTQEFPGGTAGYESGIVTAVARVQSLAWGLLHAMGTTKKKSKFKK